MDCCFYPVGDMHGVLVSPLPTASGLPGLRARRIWSTLAAPGGVLVRPGGQHPSPALLFAATE